MGDLLDGIVQVLNLLVRVVRCVIQLAATSADDMLIRYPHIIEGDPLQGRRPSFGY